MTLTIFHLDYCNCLLMAFSASIFALAPVWYSLRVRVTLNQSINQTCHIYIQWYLSWKTVCFLLSFCFSLSSLSFKYYKHVLKFNASQHPLYTFNFLKEFLFNEDFSEKLWPLIQDTPSPTSYSLLCI